ncbi:cohesin domain-containing protein [Geobacter argillaceus]|uniref:Cohesin domain-containing protein n=1 Tax=Geobacter argillaceus TaxID=345631 RepID=A0A562VP21_9BACT|nr:cohesin domain-containing protein [Geobacter argillaceus]TWJ19645.1 cohesin domain-containing protein [Geobacter argillaceus]
MMRARKFVSALLVRGVLLLLALSVGLPGWSVVAEAASITASPTGDGVYAIQGIGFSGVSGLDVTVTYDSSTLGNPRVVQGTLLANALFAANPNVPGVIRIGALSTSGFSGTGVIAAITFDKKAGAAGSLTGLTASLINSSGAPLAVTTSYSNAPATYASQTVQTDTTAPGTPTPTTPSIPITTGAGGSGATGIAGTSTGGSVYLGTVSMPGDAATSQPEKKAEYKAETQKADQQPLPNQEAVDEQARDRGKAEPEEKKAPVEKKDIVYPSVSEKIRTSSEKLTMEKLLALFELSTELPYSQAPGVVLSDGKTSVRLTVRLGESGKETPSFALKHAKLLSLQQGEGGEWLIEALPALNTNEAALTVSLEASSIRIPLTVAQPLNARSLGDLKVLSERTFPLFLTERGTKEAPRYDLNGDGKRDYLDDYIFAANYLAGGGRAPLPDRLPAPAAPAVPKKP